MEGLRRLEYRGYDSAGVAVVGEAQKNGESRVEVVRTLGKLSELTAALQKEPLAGTVGIGHTRWATHGRPSEENAHPHKVGRVVLVHNGIIENHLALKEQLAARGRRFSSETDTEILAHLVDEQLEKGNDPTSALRIALQQVEGTWAIAVLIDGFPQEILAAKNSSPLILGQGEEENFVASDIPALLPYTRQVLFLEDGDVARVRPDSILVQDREGGAVQREIKTVTWSPVMAEKGGFKHFMLKEIHEQPRAIADTMRGRVSLEQSDVFLGDFDIEVKNIARVFVVACGTSYHAALVGKFLIEGLARIPVEVDLGSEFRYRDPLIGKNDLMVAISQSGETADTLAAVRAARQRGAKIVSICNVVDSQIPRNSDGAIYTHAGPEIGVASTKAFTTQLTALFCLAVHLGRRSGALQKQRARDLLEGLLQIPAHTAAVIEQAAQLNVIARRYAHCSDFLYLGRGINYPIALEGALKLKEISYIHAEGYPAGEMKHGPIALIDEDLPVVVLTPSGSAYEKILNNLQEVRARDGKVIAVATHGDTRIGTLADDLFLVPDVPDELQPLLYVVPLQLLAYYVADFKGTDVDQPRNLAKSVTVE
jgi:glucosamine--fructose-6-phosphate aminotransferase (isomerizing)